MASKAKPRNVQVVAKQKHIWNQLIEQVCQRGTLHTVTAYLAIQPPLPGKDGPGTTRLGKRLGCPSGICLGNPWMLICPSSNTAAESVTSSTVAI